MGNKQEGKIIIDIVLKKLCYYPGETINGYIKIKPRTQLDDSILRRTSIKIRLIEYQEYSFSNGSGNDKKTECVNEYSYKSIQTKDYYKRYKYFKGANILLGIQIPFSIIIPLNTQSTFYVCGDYIIHCLDCGIPSIGGNGRINIIIKDHRLFTLENKLLKIQKINYLEYDIIYKKKGRMSCLFKLPKNSFTYFEKIPFELHLDCTGFNGLIISVTISLNKYIYKNHKSDHKKHFKTAHKEEIANKHLDYNDNNLQKYEFKDCIEIPRNEKFDKI